MKKIFYLMSLCALALISCQKEELADNDSVGGKYTYTFVVNHIAEAKASVGDKIGNQWPVLWEKGDRLGVYQGETFIGTALLNDDSDGQNSGTFTLTTSAQLTEETELYFAYPYVENAEVRTGKIATEQTLSTASSAGIGANAVAYAEDVVYKSAGTEFTLTHSNAYIKFNVSSSTADGHFGGYTLNGITLWADGMTLSGNVTVGTDGGMTVTEGGEDYVKLTLDTPVEVTSDARPLWLTVMPVSKWEAEGEAVNLYAIIHMTKGIETVTLPIRLNGAGALVAGSVTEINLPDLYKGLSPAWYEPVETRYIAAYGEGWCYGMENTVLFETNANVTKTLDLKARGNFRKVREPKYVQLKYSCDREHGNYIAIDDASGYADSEYPEFEVGDDYAIDVMPRKKQNNYGWLGGLLIKDSNKNVIWGINLWASYSTITPVVYDNGSVLPYNIGAGPVQSSTDNWYMNGVYFQWGRPFAFPWTAGVLAEKSLIEDATPDLDASASNPYVMYCYSDPSYNDWNYNKHSADFWGNPSADATGMKSIFDPCPKGYRVISPAIIKEITDNISKGEDDKIVVSGDVEYSTSTNVSHFKYKDVEWPLAGGFFNNNGAATSRSDNKKELAAYWTNSVYGNSGYVWFHQNKSTTEVETVKIMKSDSGKATAFPVRCMVDTENR